MINLVLCVSNSSFWLFATRFCREKKMFVEDLEQGVRRVGFDFSLHIFLLWLSWVESWRVRQKIGQMVIIRVKTLEKSKLNEWMKSISSRWIRWFSDLRNTMKTGADWNLENRENRYLKILTLSFWSWSMVAVSSMTSCCRRWRSRSILNFRSASFYFVSNFLEIRAELLWQKKDVKKLQPLEDQITKRSSILCYYFEMLIHFWSLILYNLLQSSVTITCAFAKALHISFESFSQADRALVFTSLFSVFLVGVSYQNETKVKLKEKKKIIGYRER